MPLKNSYSSKENRLLSVVIPDWPLEAGYRSDRASRSRGHGFNSRPGDGSPVKVLCSFALRPSSKLPVQCVTVGQSWFRPYLAHQLPYYSTLCTAEITWLNLL